MLKPFSLVEKFPPDEQRREEGITTCSFRELDERGRSEREAVVSTKGGSRRVSAWKVYPKRDFLYPNG
jgi:hypothetical protein